MYMGTVQRPLPLSILLVDDSALFRITLKTILERYRDFAVVGEASDGNAALELALSLTPQVVIIEVHMPRLGGVEATRRLKRMLPDLYVIGLSSCDDADTQTAMKTAGSSAFLSKGKTHQLPQQIALLTGRLVPVKISPEAISMETYHEPKTG